VSGANGYSPKKAVLYARVSTEEQARSGYSLAQQMEALRDYAAREGYEVLEEVVDPGQSGASLGRPGMDRVRDLVGAGGVSVVLAQDRDRFAREPAYHYLLRKEFEEHRTKICALNDRGDDSPEGELTDGILDQLAKFERAKTAERTRRGRLRKAREGRVIAGCRADYGYRYNKARDSYVVHESEMVTVRRIFNMFGAEGASVYGVKAALDASNVPPPGKALGRGVHWTRTFIRGCVFDDVYKPHTFVEVSALVSPQVAARLDPDRLYGIWWYNRREAQRTRVLEDYPDGERRYVTRTRYADKPREEWIAVPVPDAGVTRELVDRARAALKGNAKCSGAGRRFWELSGGILRCAECGRALVATTTLKGTKNYRRRMFYYQCATRGQVGKHACSFSKSINAEKAETAVWKAVSALLTDPERLRQDLEAMIEREKETRGDPEPEAKVWAAKLSEVERKRDKYQEMFAADAMTLDELRSKLDALDETRETARRELATLASWNDSLEAFERDKDRLLESYATLAPEALAALNSEERHAVYSMLGLCVEALPDKSLRIRGAFGEENLVWEKERTSTR
jgi:site-specific DNA recombinase